MALSDDGSTLAYGLSDEEGLRQTILVNEVPGPSFKGVWPPVLSSDGRTVAYRASDDGETWFIVVNGVKVSAAFDFSTDPAVSRDGKMVAYAGEIGDRSRLFLGHRSVDLVGEFPNLVFLSDDGAAWGYATRTAVVTAQGRSETFDEVKDPSFDPEGRRVLFAARRGQQWFLVVGEHRFEASGLVGKPSWNPDGGHIGFGALRGHELWWNVRSVR